MPHESFNLCSFIEIQLILSNSTHKEKKKKNTHKSLEFCINLENERRHFSCHIVSNQKKIWETPYFSLSNATHPWPLPLAGLAYFCFTVGSSWKNSSHNLKTLSICKKYQLSLYNGKIVSQKTCALLCVIRSWMLISFLIDNFIYTSWIFKFILCCVDDLLKNKTT